MQRLLNKFFKFMTYIREEELLLISTFSFRYNSSDKEPRDQRNHLYFWPIE